MKDLAKLFTLLSEPVRLNILAMLSGGELCVCKINASLNLPQSTVSRHLALLRLHGIVETRRMGTWMHYRLARESWQKEWRAILELAISEAAAKFQPGDSPNVCQPDAKIQHQGV